MNVKIVNGLYRGHKINDTFEVVKPWVDGARGGYITVKAEQGAIFQTRTPRIMAEQSDCTLLDESGNELSEQHIAVLNNAGSIVTETNYELALMQSETDEEAMARIRHSFEMLSKVADSVASGTIRGLIVSGPPGIGKSHEVEERLKFHGLFSALAGDANFEIISGAASAIGLYQLLWNHREKGHIICFDDSDGVLFEEESITLLKSALNSGHRRRICWHKESRINKSNDIPEAFDFHGSIIFLTNIDFQQVIAKGSRIGAHLAAIVSRCHYMDLEIGSMRDKLLRIRQVIADGMLDKYDFKNGELQTIINWVHSNKDTLQEVSLRMVSKLADLIKADPDGWRELAEATLLTREARYKRLYINKQLQVEQDAIEV